MRTTPSISDIPHAPLRQEITAMNSTKYLWLSLLVGSLALAGCDSGEDAADEEGDEAAEASGDEAAGEEGGEEAAADDRVGEEAAGDEGGEEAAGDEPTSQPAAEAAAAGDFAANAGALHGTWNADFQAMLASQEMTEEERAMATTFLAGAQMALTFNADGSLAMGGVMMGQEQTESGTWSEVGAEANVLTISTTSASEGAEAETETMTVTFASATSIMIADPEGEAIPFNKAQ